MFGYVKISKLDLTFRDYSRYKSYYCGVCRSIKDNYGEIERLSLNYDIVFLAILLSAFHEKEEEIKHIRCILNPLNKKKTMRNNYVEYSSAINQILVYHKFLDNYIDEKSKLSLIASKLMHKNYEKAKRAFPHKENIVKIGLQKMREEEKSKEPSLIELSNIFGEILGKIFVLDERHENAKNLKNIGSLIGIYIYILDCFDDFDEDIKRRRFNPLICENTAKVKDEAKSIVENIIMQVEKELSKIEFKQNKTLIENILILGLKNKWNSVLKKEKR